MEENTTPQAPMRHEASRNTLGVPIAIVIAAVCIAGAIVYSGRTSNNAIQIGNDKQINEQQTAEMDVAPISENDHIFGNPNAPILIVEYSDFDCPYCKNFHETMQRIMEMYGSSGKVAWVYRHFPIQKLHPNSPKVAAASECVASLGGNDAFWKFASAIVSDRGINEPTNINKLTEYATGAGVDGAKFDECLKAGTFDEKIKEDIALAMKAGAKGTPYSVMIVGDQQGVIDGAQPFDVVKQMIDTMLAQLGGQATESNPANE